MKEAIKRQKNIKRTYCRDRKAEKWPNQENDTVLKRLNAETPTPGKTDKSSKEVEYRAPLEKPSNEIRRSLLGCWCIYGQAVIRRYKNHGRLESSTPKTKFFKPMKQTSRMGSRSEAEEGV